MLKKLMFCIASMIVPVAATEIDDLTFLTEQYPPYNYERNGQVKGLSMAVFESLMARAGATRTAADVQVLPWVRAYETARSTPNTVLFSTIRTPAREELFKWVGPIAPDRTVLLARQHDNIILPSIAALNASDLQVVVIRQDIGEQRLHDAGADPERLRTAIDNRSAMHMLARDRVDLWAYGEEAAYWLIAENGIEPSTFEPVFVLSDADLYFALNIETDDAVVRDLQAIMDEMHADGTISAIMER